MTERLEHNPKVRAAWEAFMDKIPQEFSDSVRTVWGRICEAKPNAAVPSAFMTDDDMFTLSWTSSRYLFTCVIDPAERVDWFFFDRETNKMEGTEHPVEELPDAAISLLVRFI
jgi:hypothetical protein